MVSRRLGRSFWLGSPEHWIYPIQAIACGVLLIWFWRDYELGALRQIGFVVAIALLVFLIWISPQAIFGFPLRVAGFNPEGFSGRPGLYWTMIIFRFLRLVVVVPLVEEVFWRGFLLRYLIKEQFFTVPIGTFSWLSCLVVMVGFTFAHGRADWLSAFIAGGLYNLVAYRCKSLASCALAHSLTNLFLGLWIMKTGQWGFW